METQTLEKDDTVCLKLSTFFRGRSTTPAIVEEWPNGLRRSNHIERIKGQTPYALNRVQRPNLVTKLLVTFGS